MPLRFTNQLTVPRESAHLPLCPRQASSAETLGPDDRRHPHARPSRPEGLTVGAGSPHPDPRASLSGVGGPHPDPRASLSGRGILIRTQGSHCRGRGSSPRPEGLTVRVVGRGHLLALEKHVQYFSCFRLVTIFIFKIQRTDERACNLQTGIFSL